jgi:hypothetical protein
MAVGGMRIEHVTCQPDVGQNTFACSASLARQAVKIPAAAGNLSPQIGRPDSPDVVPARRAYLNFGRSRGRGKMWRLAGRTAGVFLFWGVLLLLAVGAGMKASVAELCAACGAGGTLMVWGTLIRRQERLLDAATSLTMEEPPRERATP